MAKTNMLMREKKRLKIAKKYAKRRAELKELIRDPKTGQEGARSRASGSCRSSRAMQALPGSAIAARSPAARAACTANSAWRAPSCARRPIAARFQACRRRVGEARTMSMTDPIADLLTRIRNAQSAGKPTVGMGASKLKVAILKVLKDEGYIADFGVDSSRRQEHPVHRTQVSRRPSGHRSHRTHQPSGPAHLSRQGRAAQGAGRLGRRRGFHSPGHHVRQASARGRHRRRSAVRRSIGFIGLR